MATNYDIDYNDKRFTEVEAAKDVALNEVNTTYNDMISKSDKYFEDQIKASQDFADKQTDIQNQKTDQAIKEINQQKAQAQKDYTKEQSGAYVDWQKQSNEYGANAEQMAAQGMTNTGYSESSQVSMYNTYQNRVASARASFEQAKLNYDNAITNAQLQNSSILAEIAAEAYQKQLELSLQGFQYKNQLITELSNKKLAIESEYHNRYQDVLKQINTENALAEEVRQYNEQMAEEKRQYNETLALQKEQLAEQKRQFDATHSGSSGGSGGSIKGGSSGSSSSKATASYSKSSYEKKLTKDEKVKHNSGKNDDSVTMESILKLGYGPISAAKAYELVKQGKAYETRDKNGNVIFKKENGMNHVNNYSSWSW